MRELAVTAVLDERGAVDDSLAAADGVSVRSVRETVETARALEDLPEVAAVAFEGRLSDEQLGPVARLADASSDAEWAQRAPNTAPSDLARLARTVENPTMDEARARRGADALVQLCRDCADEHAVATPNVVMVVEVPEHGLATVAGIPVPDEMVQALRSPARIEPVLVDETRTPVTTGKARAPL
jgi:hypothetical protein